MTFANRHNWTPEQVNALPSDFVDELVAYYNAESDHDKAEKKRAEREAKKNGKRSS